MKTTKNAYLAKLTEQIQMKSVKVGKNLEGTTPPSVFIGRWSYPKVYAGPMMSSQMGDTSIMDSPESWIGENKSQDEIINYRMNLVRGKQLIKIDDLENPFVEKLQDISLASKTIDSEATFKRKPRGSMLTEDSMPHGPSAAIETFDIDAVKWDRQLEKTFYDTDLKAVEAVVNLHNKDVPFTAMQKAFSVGAIGTKNNRKLVPTRWSITACDSTLADEFLKEVRKMDILDTYRVYEFGALNNYYIIILTPTEWQYEWYEAFIKIMKNEELIFSDYETNGGKKEYSIVGGCYYTAKMAVLDYLMKIKKQSGLVILREAYDGYVPLGVFNVRENIKEAMLRPYLEFETLEKCLEYAGTRLKIPINRYVKQGTLLNEMLHTKQTTLDMFLKVRTMFKFKSPSKETLNVMSEVAKGNLAKDYEESCIRKIQNLTTKEHVKVTSSGNNSIFIALSAIKGDIIIPDQGGWHGFKQIAKFLNKNLITLKTDSGLINTDYLDELEFSDDSALIFTSFAGYTAEQDVEKINAYCTDNNILTIEDASAGVGDGEGRLGCRSDIILASTGSPKIINVGSGGFIATNDEEIFKSSSIPQKLSKTNEIICSGIDNEIDNVSKNLELSLNATENVKKHIPNTLHQDKRGINVIIPHDNAKSICWDLKKKLTTDKSGIITTCPNYNRIKQKAICIEIKNLDYDCLEKEYLDIIIDEVNSQLQV